MAGLVAWPSGWGQQRRNVERKQETPAAVAQGDGAGEQVGGMVS